jgi:hypothetical protein
VRAARIREDQRVLKIKNLLRQSTLRGAGQKAVETGGVGDELELLLTQRRNVRGRYFGGSFSPMSRMFLGIQ